MIRRHQEVPKKGSIMFKDVHAYLWPVGQTPVEIRRYYDKRAISERLEKTLSTEGFLEKSGWILARTSIP
jgi:hypothetical protein